MSPQYQNPNPGFVPESWSLYGVGAFLIVLRMSVYDSPKFAFPVTAVLTCVENQQFGKTPSCGDQRA